MKDILLKVVETNDIPQWLKLSHEYDLYINKLVGNLDQWYKGNEKDIAFSDYMIAKITKREAMMAIDITNSFCLRIIAFTA